MIVPKPVVKRSDDAAPIAPVAVHPYDASLRITAASIRLDKTRSRANGLIPVVMTTAREDRHGSTIRPAAWAKRLASFLANPVMQWAHISWIPTVGNALNLQQDGEQWIADLKFATDAWSSFGGANLPKLLEDLMNDDMLRAVSPGFMPHAFVKRIAADMPQFLDPENVEYTDVELMEISPCNVPSGREALQRALQRNSVSPNGIDALIQLGVLPSVFGDTPITILGRSAPAPIVQPVTEDRMKLSIGATVRFLGDDINKANSLIRACGFEVDGTVVGLDADGSRASVEFLSPSYSGIFRSVEAARIRVTAEAPTGFSIDEYAQLEAVKAARAARTYRTDGETRVEGKSPQARIAAIRTAIRITREALRDYCYMDYGGVVECCPICGTPETIGCDCSEQAAPDVAAIEQQTISDLIDITSEQLATALAGWDGSQHSSLRFHCSMLVWDCMYRIDRLLAMADYWYPDMQFGNPADVSTEEMRKYAAWANDPKNREAVEGIMTRVGAEISTKNRSKLQGMCDRAEQVAEHANTIADQCREMLKATDAATGDEPADDARSKPGAIRVIGSVSQGKGESAGHIRVFASDPSPAGGRAASTSSDRRLYDENVLHVK